MFRLLSLDLKNHPTLLNVNLEFTTYQDKSTDCFTSVLIGMNGTGKSFILKALGDIFYQIEQHLKTEGRERTTYSFHIRYQLNNTIYDVFSSQWIKEIYAKPPRETSNINVLENRPESEPLIQEVEKPFTLSKYSIDLYSIKLPQKVIVSSTQLNDRFTFRKDEQSKIYRYCGAKRTARSISTNAFKRNIADSLLYATQVPNINNLLETTIVDYLGFKKHLEVNYRTRYSSQFFKGDLTKEKLHDFFIKYKETTKRKTQPWGTWKYTQITGARIITPTIVPNSARIDEIIEFVNFLSKTGVLQKVKNSDSKRLSLDFFSLDIKNLDFSILLDLQSLDLIYLEEIKIKKDVKEIKLSETSAGENQIIMSLLTILSKIKNNSLVLIDEPEISLHPNWQMKYIHLLKRTFKQFSDCHFIIATHSHFLISDLRPESSSVISLKRDEGKLFAETINSDTYGWSAEEVLLEVFNVPTTRNYYIAEKLGLILDEIAKPNKDIEIISKAVSELVQNNIHMLSDADPLKEIIDKLIEKYG